MKLVRLYKKIGYTVISIFQYTKQLSVSNSDFREKFPALNDIVLDLTCVVIVAIAEFFLFLLQ